MESSQWTREVTTAPEEGLTIILHTEAGLMATEVTIPLISLREQQQEEEVP